MADKLLKRVKKRYKLGDFRTRKKREKRKTD